MIWRLLPYSKYEPAYNMAVDEAVFKCYLEGLVPPTLRFYGWEPPALSVGYFQDLAGEVNPANVAAAGFGMVRRPTGGRAVLHENELTYAVVAGVKDGLPDSLAECYLYISRAFVAAFQHFGIFAELQPKTSTEGSKSGACFESPSWYELKINRRKLVGSAQLRHGGSFLQHGSILIDFSAEHLAWVLQSPESLTRKQFTERLRQRITSFRDLGLEIDPQTLAGAIVGSFRDLYRIEFVEQPLLEIELQLIKEYIAAKYANPEWTHTRGKRSVKFER